MSEVDPGNRFSDDPIEDSTLLQDTVSALGFDWPDIHGVMEKVEEEVDELKHAIQSGEDDRVLHEFGDVLFALINLGRFSNLRFSEALRSANARFRERFVRMSNELEASGKCVEQCSFDDLNRAWERVKLKEGSMEN